MKKTRVLIVLGLLAMGTSTVSTVKKAPKLQVPLFFIENQGQVDSRIDYYLPGRDKSLYFNAQGMTYSLADPDKKDSRWNVKVDFLNADSKTSPEGQSVLPAKISYFKGKRSEWKTGAKTYGSLKYPDLWSGIDLVYTGHPGHLEHRFIVKPGADPHRIRMSYRGAEKVSVSPIGSLKVETAAGGFEEGGLFAYQEKDGKREQVAANFVVDKLSGEAVVGFELGRYDRGRPLIIDPEVLIYAGFIGGGVDDSANGIAVDASGNAYVTGTTLSDETTFPVVAGPSLTANANEEAFVAKVAADGSTLLYAGFIGGDGTDSGRGIAVDAGGNAYVAGVTTSDENTFPVVGGPFLTANNGANAFVAKIASDGSLDYAGFIGGDGYDQANAIAVDGDGNAYVTGATGSDESTFPVAVGPGLTAAGGPGAAFDIFVAKVAADGTSLVYAGFIGGDDGEEEGAGIAVDGAGSAYVTGYTASSEATFPVKVGPNLVSQGGDAYVAKVAADGASLVYAGYIGGNGNDVGRGIAVDGAGNAYITGDTTSSGATFTKAVGPDLSPNGGVDAFIAKVAADGASLVYAGFIGGSGNEGGLGIAVDGSGNAYVAGTTTSTQSTFPVKGGPDLEANGGSDAFLAKVTADGVSLVYAGFIGGSGNDEGNGIAIDPSGNAYVAGSSLSTQSSFPVTGGPDLTAHGGEDAFVVKFGLVTDCGDGLKEGSEECDGGGANSDSAPDACRADCTSPSCGDGVKDTGEECDTGGGAADTCASGTACVAVGEVSECTCQEPTAGTTGGSAGGTAGSASGDGGGCSLIADLSN